MQTPRRRQLITSPVGPPCSSPFVPKHLRRLCSRCQPDAKSCRRWSKRSIADEPRAYYVGARRYPIWKHQLAAGINAYYRAISGRTYTPLANVSGSSSVLNWSGSLNLFLEPFGKQRFETEHVVDLRAEKVVTSAFTGSECSWTSETCSQRHRDHVRPRTYRNITYAGPEGPERSVWTTRRRRAWSHLAR